MRTAALGGAIVATLGVQLFVVQEFRARRSNDVSTVATVETTVPLATTSTALTLAPASTIQPPAIPGGSVVPAVTAFGMQIDVASISALRIDDQTLALDLAARLTNIGSVPQRAPQPVLACGSARHEASASTLLQRTRFGEAPIASAELIKPGGSVARWFDPVLLPLPPRAECSEGMWLVLRLFPPDGTDIGPNGYLDAERRAVVLLDVDVKGLIDTAPPFPVGARSVAMMCESLAPPAILRKVGATDLRRQPTCALQDRGKDVVTLAVYAEPRLVTVTRGEVSRSGIPIPVVRGEGFLQGQRLVVFDADTVTILMVVVAVPDSATVLTDLGRLLGLIV